MRKIILVYGSIAGAVIIGSMIIGFIANENKAASVPQWLGYLIMIVAFSMIFVGVKRYRDADLGGVIKFGRAFLVGLSIALVASFVYVATWEVYLYATDYKFIDIYAASVIEAKRAAGVSGEALDAVVGQMEAMAKNYDNPLFRLPMTFLEIFPVGLIVALASAAILRNPKAFPARA